MLAVLAQQADEGRPVAPWEWLVAAGMGPFLLTLLKVLFHFVAAGGRRFAEIRGDRVRLGPVGYAFHVSRLVFCKIEPDARDSQINHLCFGFRQTRFSHPQYYTMMIEDLGKGEEFQRELVERIA